MYYIIVASIIVGFLTPEFFACLSQGKANFPLFTNIISAIAGGLFAYGYFHI